MKSADRWVTALPSHSNDANLGVKKTALSHMFAISNCPPLTMLQPIKVCKNFSVTLCIIIIIIIIIAVQFYPMYIILPCSFSIHLFCIVLVLHRTVSLSVGSPFMWRLVSLFQVLFLFSDFSLFPLVWPGPTLATLYCTHLTLFKYIWLTYPDLGGSRQLWNLYHSTRLHGNAFQKPNVTEVDCYCICILKMGLHFPKCISASLTWHRPPIFCSFFSILFWVCMCSSFLKFMSRHFVDVNLFTPCMGVNLRMIVARKGLSPWLAEGLQTRDHGNKGVPCLLISGPLLHTLAPLMGLGLFMAHLQWTSLFHPWELPHIRFVCKYISLFTDLGVSLL